MGRRSDPVIREATAPDVSAIVRRLEETGHLWGVVHPERTAFLQANVASARAGFVGFERGASAMLLRSLFVELAHRSAGLGRLLVEAVHAEALRRGLTRVYVFSTDAGPYWLRLGYTEVPITETVEATRGAPQTDWAAAQPDVIAAEVTYAKDLS